MWSLYMDYESCIHYFQEVTSYITYKYHILISYYSKNICRNENSHGQDKTKSKLYLSVLFKNASKINEFKTDFIINDSSS